MKLLKKPLDPETVAATIRITGGNFRSLNRLLTQIERILEINASAEVNREFPSNNRETADIETKPINPHGLGFEEPQLLRDG